MVIISFNLIFSSFIEISLIIGAYIIQISAVGRHSRKKLWKEISFYNFSAWAEYFSALFLLLSKRIEAKHGLQNHTYNLSSLNCLFKESSLILNHSLVICEMGLKRRLIENVEWCNSRYLMFIPVTLHSPLKLSLKKQI